MATSKSKKSNRTAKPATPSTGAASVAIKQPPILYEKTQAIIAELVSCLNGPVVAYWNNQRGELCHNDVIALYAILERLGPHGTLHLFVKSSGGNGQAALRIVNLIRQYCKRLIVMVPLECASAATMLALGANEILMGPMAYLTAVDTSLTHDLSPIDRDNDRVSVSLDELNRAIRLWHEQPADKKENAYQALFQYVHPLVIGAVDRAESLSIMLCKDLLANHIDDADMVTQIAHTLNGRYPSHSYPILREEAERLGLAVQRMDARVNSLLLSLNERYSEMGQKATTDFDESRAHGNEIVNIWETSGTQVFYQQDKDWFYRAEERRWVTMNDHSGWRRVQKVRGQIRKSVLHIA